MRYFEGAATSAPSFFSNCSILPYLYGCKCEEHRKSTEGDPEPLREPTPKRPIFNGCEQSTCVEDGYCNERYSRSDPHTKQKCRSCDRQHDQGDGDQLEDRFEACLCHTTSRQPSMTGPLVVGLQIARITVAREARGFRGLLLPRACLRGRSLST